MASLNTDPNLLPDVLKHLKPLDQDRYILAFGPEGKQFVATPNGYAATYVPPKILPELANPYVSKVLWASYGDEDESWFFAYQIADGRVKTRLGDKAPHALRNYVDSIREGSSESLLSSLRVQLGNDRSFVVWTKTAWACFNVPQALRDLLCELSATKRAYNDCTMGSFRNTTIMNVTWHPDGSYFLRTQNNQVAWVFFTTTMQNAWNKMWSEAGSQQITDLAYVAIDPHALVSKTFALIKKQQQHADAPFVLHFANELVYFRLFTSDRQLQIKKTMPSGNFRWAVSKFSGRPHQDIWELELKKGEKVKVWREEGQGWYLVEHKKGMGYCHCAWLELVFRREGYPRVAWNRFTHCIGHMMLSAPIKEFPSIPVGKCAVGCGSGLCVHNLEVVLRGSGKYSVEFLKKERLMWHPDRFAQFCLPEFAELLCAEAAQVFKLYGVLLEQEMGKAGGA